MKIPIRSHSFDLNSTTKMVQSLSATGTLLAVSPKWLEVMGFTLEEALNKPFSSLVDESTLKNLKKNFPHLIKYGFVDNVQFIVKTKENKKIKLILNGSSEVDEKGDFVHSYCELMQINALDDDMRLEFFEKDKFYKSMMYLKKNIMEILEDKHTIDGFLESLRSVLMEPIEITDVMIEDSKGRDTSNFLICKELFENNNKIDSYNGFILKENDFPKELKVNESTAFLIFLKIIDPSLKLNYRLIVIGVDNYKQILHEWYESFLSIIQIIELAISIIQHDINISIHKKNEILLSEAKKFAEQSSQSKSEFLANMSHEIRTPINAVIGMLYLTSKTELNDTQKSYISKADNAAKSLLGIIDDILDYSKVEAGKLKMESIDFQLEETISHISDIVAHQAKDKGIEFVVKHDPEIPEILVGDSLRLRQILINITNNAIKFTQKGEVIFSQKLLSKDDENVTILFCVEDSGIGISKEEQKKLFQEFVQVDGSLTRKYGGTGLGLAISKKLAEMMNGKIWIESSEPNVGTTVCCTVTLKTSSHSLDSYTFSKSLPEIFSSMNVLIVDDNASAREALFEMLKPLKFNVEMASSAKEAISMLEDSDMAYDFDLVFMDWKMPVMNGIEGSKAIRTSKKISKQPKIIMLTAYSKEEIIYEAGKDGIDAYLIKPVSPSLLFDTIMQTLGLSVAKKIEQSEEISLESIIGAKILLAEDNELNQDFALGLLRNKGLQVDVANNGEIALKMVQENRYDFVLMDIQMPVMNGLTATHHIRELAVEKKDKYYETLPIIAMTAHAMSDDRDRSIDAGMNEHITKPIDPDTIFSTLLRFIKPRKDTAMKKVESKDNSAQDNIDFSMLKNLNTNEALHRLDGDEKAYKKILLRFRDKYSNLSNEIQKLAKEEIDAAEKKCHELKGIFANIGANKLYEVILLIDDTLKNSELPSQTLYKRLEEEMAVIFDSISLFETSLDDNKISTNETFDTIKAKELLHRLLESLDHDIAESETILDQLEPIMASSKEYNMFKDVSKKVTLFEIKKAKELLLLLLKQLGEM